MVNFSFISALEGGPVLTGYVPDPVGSNSGVTIATGFDIGQRSDDDLISLLPNNPALVDLLAPYCLLKKQAAVDALSIRPLVITAAQASEIDGSVKIQKLAVLVRRYNRASDANFYELPESLQTVIASVAFQYGDLASRCPKFWHVATRADRAGMIAELRNFGDRYPTRRRREADYLQQGAA